MAPKRYDSLETANADAALWAGRVAELIGEKAKTFDASQLAAAGSFLARCHGDAEAAHEWSHRFACRSSVVLATYRAALEARRQAEAA